MALLEHALVAAEPMWNYDTEPLKKYLEAAAGKNNYQSLKLIDDDGTLIIEAHDENIEKVEKELLRLGIIPRIRFKQEIIYDEQQLGWLDVEWRDTSIYFYSYAFLISLLLIVITNLYSSVFVAKKALEGKIAEKEKAMEDLQSQKEYIEGLFNVVPEGLITIGRDQKIVDSNQSFEVIVDNWARSLSKDTAFIKRTILSSLNSQLEEKDQGHFTITIDEQTIHIDFSSSEVFSVFNIDRVISLRDTTKLNAMKRELAQTQKLESVGRLAAGIAHEINTPTQYVHSNIDFLDEIFEDVSGVMRKVALLDEHVEEGQNSQEVIHQLRQSYDEADWEYLEEEIPSALLQSKEGLRRISSIVSAMKHFSHPSGDSPEPNDINKALKNTVAVATNEWKYVADLDLQLSPSLPLVPCFLDELNQVFLAMIVNSAHAIEEKNGKESELKGKITITTASDDKFVDIRIEDDGNGMPDSVRDKVFDPFFTTKELNKGTGQGLAIAHDVIVKRHNGSITVDSKQGSGTTFSISLPCEV